MGRGKVIRSLIYSLSLHTPFSLVETAIIDPLKKLTVQINVSGWYHNHYMWQSQVEIEHYSVVHFDHITVFKVLYKHKTYVISGAHACCVNS